MRISPSKLAAPNAAMTSLDQGGHHWRGIGAPGLGRIEDHIS